MSTRAMKGLVAVTLIGAASGAILGCADILGADFNRDFGGGGGGSTSVSASSAAATSSSSSGTGGGTPAYECHLGGTESAERVTVTVSAKPALMTGVGAEDFYSFRDGFPAVDVAHSEHVSSYELFTSFKDARVPLFQCPKGGNHIVTSKGQSGCDCLGFATTSPFNARQLHRIVGNEQLSTSAFTTDFTNCLQYGHKPGGCVDTESLFSPK